MQAIQTATQVPPLNHNEPSIDVLAEQWLCMKALIQSNMAELRRIENVMLPLLDSKEEGQLTTSTRLGRRITVNKRINYSLNGKSLLKIRNEIPTDLLPLKSKEILDEARLRWLRNNEPQTYAILATAITATPGKPTITVKDTDND